jgi:Family of unknown function (DUF6221)
MAIITNLDERLRAAITQRLELAQAATPGPWRVAAEGSEGSRVAPDYQDKRERTRFIAMVNGRVQPEDGRNARHIAANDPATIIRHCERDLKVLDRHRTCGTPDEIAAHPRYPNTACAHCGSNPWPCEDIEWLAEAYQVVIT